jgi:hypothetical protein
MKKYTITLFVILISHLTIAQKVNQLKLDNKQSILNKRVFLHFPDSAKNLTRPVGIMSHDPNAEKETRIVFDNGAERLVFFAQELFLLGDDKLLESMKADKSEEFLFEYTELIKNKEITAIQTLPTKWDNTKGGILINSLTIMTKDNSLIRIDAYINPTAYESQKEIYIDLTKRVFNTIKAGKRFNNRKPRVEKHNILGTKKDFIFDLPKDYIIQIDQKYDFQVFRLKKYNYISDTTWQSISIYIGHHPSYAYPDYGFDNYTEKQNTEFLGLKTDWLYFEDNERKLFLKEQKIESDNIEKGIITHISLSSNSSETILKLSEFIKTITLK